MPKTTTYNKHEETNHQSTETVKKDRKFIIIAAGKNLGPCILDIELYIIGCLGDHLNKANTYKEVT